jgi:hypothetical protein
MIWRRLLYLGIVFTVASMSLLLPGRTQAAWRTRNTVDYIDFKKICTDGMLLSFAFYADAKFTDPRTITLGAIRNDTGSTPAYDKRGTYFGSVIAPPRAVTVPYNPTTIDVPGWSKNTQVTHLLDNIVIFWNERLSPGTKIGVTFMQWLFSDQRGGILGRPEYVIFPLSGRPLVADVMYGSGGDGVVSPDCSVTSALVSESQTPSPNIHFPAKSRDADIVNTLGETPFGLAAVPSEPLTHVGQAEPSTFYVSTPADDPLDEDLDADPDDGVCSTAMGRCTFRAAIQEVNQVFLEVNQEADTIMLPAGIFRLMRASDDGNHPTAALDDLNIVALIKPNLIKNVTIIGAGVDKTIIDANWISRVFQITKGHKVTIANVTIRNGFSGVSLNEGFGEYSNIIGHQPGGAIFIADGASLVIRDSTLTGNIALSNGGAIYNAGDLTLINVRFSHNSAGGAGNDVYNIGTLHVVNTTYVPLIAVSPPAPAPSPDLIIVGVPQVLPATPQAGQPTEVRVTIKNTGTADVVSPFWVDLYINPSEQPRPNRIWPDISRYGVAWRVYGLVAGDTITLSTRQPDDPHDPASRYSNFTTFAPSGAHQLYALVDSFADGQSLGIVEEVDERNNLVGPVEVTVQGKTGVDSTTPSVLTPRPGR